MYIGVRKYKSFFRSEKSLLAKFSCIFIIFGTIMFPLHVLRSNPKLGSSHVAKETLLSKRKVIKFYSEDYSSLFEMMKNWHYI